MSRAPLPTPPADGPPDWEALGRFLSGDCEPAEAEAIAAWLAAHPEDAHLLHALGETTASLASAPIDTEAALASVLARRGASTIDRDVPSLDAARRRAATAPPRPVPVPSAPRAWRQAAIGVAATLAIVFASSRLWQSREPMAPDNAVAFAPLVTAPGAIDSLRLPDGTEVILGPGSTLTPSSSYGVTAREVTLEGEAYFVVTRDDARPFTVLADHARIVDLGTAFTVRSDGERGVAVAVTSGRVRLGAANSDVGAVELAAGEAATLSNADSTVRRDSLDAERALAFTQGRLVLRDTPVESLVELLRRWYGLSLTIDPALRGRRVTAAFVSESREVVLETLALSLGARTEVRGDSVTLRRLETP